MGIDFQRISKAIAKAALTHLSDQRGQDLAEYALLLGLVGLIVVAAIIILGTNISEVFSALASGLPF